MSLGVVVFNLGGPDRLEAVRPFLFNLFNDGAILRMPQPFRAALAWVISSSRAKGARATYGLMGGGSPILANTKAQADALEGALGGGEAGFKLFIAMRHWHPMTYETVRAVKDWGAEHVVLLPLYPQFSTTTTGSSYGAWGKMAAGLKLKAPTRLLCCYPVMEGFVRANAEILRGAHERAAAHGRPRVLFSAHSLPEKIVAAGDPYRWQTEQSAAAIAGAAGIEGMDWQITYQSKVGPVPWIGPATEDAVRAAGAQRRPLVILPFSFVSEHVETTVEIGMEYRELAAAAGVPFFEAAPTAGTHPAFIAGLAGLVKAAARGGQMAAPATGERLCPPEWSGCPAR